MVTSASGAEWSRRGVECEWSAGDESALLTGATFGVMQSGPVCTKTSLLMLLETPLFKAGKLPIGRISRCYPNPDPDPDPHLNPNPHINHDDHNARCS